MTHTSSCTTCVGHKRTQKRNATHADGYIKTHASASASASADWAPEWARASFCKSGRFDLRSRLQRRESEAGVAKGETKRRMGGSSE